jgi:anti-sigma-K factor RskA
MTENFASDAHDYLLGAMEASRRAAFERELARDPAARAALKACADALAAFACEVAEPEPLSAADQRATLAAIVAATATSSAPETLLARPHERAPAARVIAWTRLAWPAAALLLLALNLIDFHRPLGPGRVDALPFDERGHPGPTAENTRPAPPSLDSTTAGENAAASATTPSPSAPPRAAPAVAELQRELERARADYAELDRVQRALRADYNALLERYANVAVTERELNRLTTMELVDPASYARGERKGLVNVGRGILTEPGVVTAPEPPPPSSTGSTIPTPKLPYAWSVFDEKEHRGYVNLYQLPTVAAGESLQVWVRPADGSGAGAGYQRVGEVPAQFYGGNGSLQYTLPAGAAAPGEILLTLEPRGANPPSPTGPVVLRGP